MIPLICTLALTHVRQSSPPPMKTRWFYVQTNLIVSQNVDELVRVIDNAKAAGFNGMVLADAKFGRLAQMGETYFANANEIRQHAKAIGLPITPVIANVGNAGALVSGNMNLVEGQPVIKVPYYVKAGVLAPVAEVSVRNGGFENFINGKLVDFISQDAPGVSTFADKSIYRSGKTSLRLENFKGGNANGNVRTTQTFAVRPWQQYQVQFWIRTSGVDKPENVRCFAVTPQNGRLSFLDLNVDGTQGWKKHTIVFNSQSQSSVNVTLGILGGNKGKIWIDDLSIREAQFLNVLRRPGTPVTVATTDGKVMKEDTDYRPVIDPAVSDPDAVGYFTFDHPFPAIKVMGSRLPNGTVVNVSYTHATATETTKVTLCPSEAASESVLKDQIRRVIDLWKPSGLFLAHDEIRVANTCPLCTSRAITAGALYADDIKRCIRLCRQYLPTGTVYMWSDMFDPYHNATDNYYLSKGTWRDSWKGLDANVVVVNWNYEKRNQSIPFFANLGVHQILSAYYDRPVSQVNNWLDSAKGISNLDGVMYTTWVGDYSQLKPFAEVGFKFR